MGIRRIFYVFALTCSISFYALYPFWFSWYLMVLIIIIAPFDLLISIPGMYTKRLSFHAPNILEQGESGKFKAVIDQKRNFPTGRVKASLLISHEDYRVRRKIKCGPENDSRYELKIDTEHSGVAVFRIKRINISSLLGLFSVPVTVNCRVTTLIMPKPVKPPRVVLLPRGLVLRPKQGGGFSEDSELRAYRAGDPIRIIHWKLSAKHDSLIIREPMAIPPNSRLVQITKWDGAYERDVVLGRLRWISDYLLKWELPYYVRCEGDGPIAEISCAEELTRYLYNLLDNSTHLIEKPAGAPIRFSWVFRIDAKEGKTE